MTEDGAQVKFDLGSSALLGAFAESDMHPAPGRSAGKYDPVAELMASDTSDDEHSDSGKGGAGSRGPSPDVGGTQTATATAGRRRLHASSFRLDKGARGGSVVARMAPARHSRAIGDESSDSDSDSSAPLPKPRNGDSSPEPDRDSEHSAGASPTKQSKKRSSTKDSPGGVRKPRAASKVAMETIHRESERLVRETAVAVDPADFTQRLSLGAFFERYSVRAASAQASKLPKRFAVPPLETKGTFAFSTGDDGTEVVIVEDPLSHQSQAAAPVLVRPTRKADAKGLVQERALDAILDYGSQPLHVSALRTGTQRTDGPLALKSLNSALLDLVYKRDVESKVAQAEKRARQRSGVGSQPEATSQEPPAARQSSPEAQNMSDGSDSEMYENGGSEDDSGSDDDDSDDDETAADTAVRSRRRAATSSDDGIDSDSGAPGRETRAAHAAVDGGAATTVSKAKFLGMFRMPVREVALGAGGSPAAPVAGPQSAQAGTAPSSQSGMELTQSQDLPGLYTSQIGNLNTQDSLLLTPDNVGAPSGPSDELSGEMLLSLGVPTQSTQRDEAAEWTQPTQPMTAASSGTQPTQLAVPTMATAEGSAAQILPSMVRRALAPTSPPSADDAEREPATSAGSPQQQQANLPAASPSPHRQGRRLLRRAGGDARARTSRRRAKRSEFVEAEAEEGESSDSEGEPGVPKSGKFNWGGGGEAKAAKADSEEDEDDDMDTDEEEAALLADPMIDNDVDEDDEGNQAIRDLHRKQDFDQDEQNIQELFKDVTTGGLRSRGLRNRTGFALAGDEDYIDRQTRAERMEERLRLRRKLLAREIHDTNLAQIAKNPETAAFAQAALMRAPTACAQSDDTDGEDAMLGDGGFDLEEEVDERSVAAAVQRHLVRGGRRTGSDAESDAEDSQNPGAGDGDGRLAGSRIVGGGSSSNGGYSTQLLASDGLSDDDAGGGAFSSVAIEKLIVRRQTRAAGGTATDQPGTAWRPPMAAAAAGLAQRPLLKRAGGAPTAWSPAKKLNMGGEQRAPP